MKKKNENTVNEKILNFIKNIVDWIVETTNNPNISSI